MVDIKAESHDLYNHEIKSETVPFSAENCNPKPFEFVSYEVSNKSDNIYARIKEEQVKDEPSAEYNGLHNEVEVHPCDICRQYCSNLQELIIHRYTHTYGTDDYTCLICYKVYKNKPLLCSHIWKCLKLECEICNKAFDTRCTFLLHKCVEKPYNCDICHKRFSRTKYLAAHMGTHIGDKQFECNICRKRFNMKKYLTVHMRIHTGEKPYQCNVCHKRFAHQHHRTEHMRTHTEEKPYVCELCGKQYSMPSALRLHMLTHTGQFECNICHKLSNRKDGHILHMLTHTKEKPHECDVCRKRFNRHSYLKKHIRTHTKSNQQAAAQVKDEPAFTSDNPSNKYTTCLTCRKVFVSQTRFCKHLQICQQRSCICDICNKSFKYKHALMEHKRIHTGEKPFQCNICHKLFNRKSNVTKHQRTHKGEKPFKKCDETLRTGKPPYQCDICHREYYQKDSLIIHMRLHVGRVKEEPADDPELAKVHRCDICRQYCTNALELVQHRYTHTTSTDRYTCLICYKMCATKKRLYQHLRRVHQNKYFECNICLESFSYKHSLKIHHRVIHAGCRQHECYICHRIFTRKNSLRTHMEVHEEKNRPL